MGSPGGSIKTSRKMVRRSSNRANADGSPRWSAVYSLRTYAYNLLHLIGLRAVDNEEVALLTAPLVRIRVPAEANGVIAHTPDPSSPTEPFGLVQARDVPFERSVFLLHFVDADESVVRPGRKSRYDRARLATAFPTETSPRAWIAADSRTGYLSLTVSETNAAAFEIRKQASSNDVALYYRCESGNYLSVSTTQDAYGRTRICGLDVGRKERLDINVLPVPLHTKASEKSRTTQLLCEPEDPNLAVISQEPWILPVHIRSFPYRFFIRSTPGTPLVGVRKAESGWDFFNIEFDSITRIARIRDSRGLYVTFETKHGMLQANLTADSNNQRVERRAILLDVARLIYDLLLSIFTSNYSRVDNDVHTPSRVLSVIEVFATYVVLLLIPVINWVRRLLPFALHANSHPSSLSKSKLLSRFESHSEPAVGSTVRTNSELAVAERFTLSFESEENDCVTFCSRRGYLSARRNGCIGISERTVPGPRERFVLQLALPSVMDDSSPSLRLRHCPHGVREIDASIVVPAHADLVYDVLRDYNGFVNFIKDCSASRLVERDDAQDKIIVEMAQTHSFLVLRITMKLTLRVHEDDKNRKVHLNLVRGLGVKTYNGIWHAMARSDGRCMLRIKLSTSPVLPTPNFLVDGIVTHAVTESLQQIRAECILRSSGDGR